MVQYESLEPPEISLLSIHIYHTVRCHCTAGCYYSSWSSHTVSTPLAFALLMLGDFFEYRWTSFFSKSNVHGFIFHFLGYFTNNKVNIRWNMATCRDVIFTKHYQRDFGFLYHCPQKGVLVVSLFPRSMKRIVLDNTYNIYNI